METERTYTRLPDFSTVSNPYMRAMVFEGGYGIGIVEHDFDTLTRSGKPYFAWNLKKAPAEYAQRFQQSWKRGEVMGVFTTMAAAMASIRTDYATGGEVGE